MLLQKEMIDAAVKTAEAARDRRNAELEAEQQAKATVENDVARLQGENSELMSHLKRLRDEFKATLEENRKMVDRLQKRSSSRPG